MKRAYFLPYFLAFLFVLVPVFSHAATPASSAVNRYFVPSTKTFWRNALGARHVFSDGFTTDLSDLQVKFMRFAGLKPIVVKKFNILTDETSPSPVASAAPSLQPIASLGWGVRFLLGQSRPATDGGDGVTIAVLDTGVDSEHQDITERIAACTDFADAKSGVVEDSCTDINGHGTHVAGIIAADGGPKGDGMFGIAPKAKILAYRVCDDAGMCFSDDIAVAIRKAVSDGAEIIVLGFGGEQESSFIDDAIGYAADHDVLLIAAAGNDGPYDDSIDWPARDARVVSVGAMTGEGTVADFSSRGLNKMTKSYRGDNGDITFVAPGVNIESTFTGGGYVILSGTSMAASHIAGLAALLWQSKVDDPAQATLGAIQKLAKDIEPEGDGNASGWGVPIMK